MHSDPFALILLQLAAVILLGLIGRYLAIQLEQPPVLGELLMGMIAATLIRASGGTVESWTHGLDVFANLGVVILLFMVGLETKQSELLAVGKQAVWVAVVGIAAPLSLGLLGLLWLAPHEEFAARLFIAAAMCATSVGITARVFQDLKILDSTEGKLVLGAAILDDVLGLMVLTLASGIAARDELSISSLLITVVATTIFLGSILWFGEKVAAFLVKELTFLDEVTTPFLLPLILCFILAWVAGELRLAALVGAFAAGLVMPNKKRVLHDTERLSLLFVPVFFVLSGLQVDLTALLYPQILGLTVGLCVIAIAGKLCAGLVVQPGVDKWTVGWAMVPRGEVGLIFAAAGREMGMLNGNLFSAVVLMIFVTTMAAPFALKTRAAVLAAREDST